MQPDRFEAFRVCRSRGYPAHGLGCGLTAAGAIAERSGDPKRRHRHCLLRERRRNLPVLRDHCWKASRRGLREAPRGRPSIDRLIKLAQGHKDQCRAVRRHDRAVLRGQRSSTSTTMIRRTSRTLGATVIQREWPLSRDSARPSSGPSRGASVFHTLQRPVEVRRASTPSPATASVRKALPEGVGRPVFPARAASSPPAIDRRATTTALTEFETGQVEICLREGLFKAVEAPTWSEYFRWWWSTVHRPAQRRLTKAHQPGGRPAPVSRRSAGLADAGIFGTRNRSWRPSLPTSLEREAKMQAKWRTARVRKPGHEFG